jgi:hypothetical protein
MFNIQYFLLSINPSFDSSKFILALFLKWIFNLKKNEGNKLEFTDQYIKSEEKRVFKLELYHKNSKPVSLM